MYELDRLKLEELYKFERELYTAIWNEAIEAAIKRIDELDNWFPKNEIRKLKK